MSDRQGDAPEQSRNANYRVGGLRAPVQSFIHTEEVGALILLAAAAAAVIWANSPWSGSYDSFWHTTIAFETPIISIHEDLKHLVNDGLMAIFFFVVGLEIKPSCCTGNCPASGRHHYPCSAAIGGMVVPALTYLLFNSSGDAAGGWGIPMATDIAFAIGVLALLGRRVPVELRVFLLGLAGGRRSRCNRGHRGFLYGHNRVVESLDFAGYSRGGGGERPPWNSFHGLLHRSGCFHVVFLPGIRSARDSGRCASCSNCPCRIGAWPR